jgi:hypothetical protein
MNNSVSRYNLVLLISLVVVAILCVQYYFKSRELRNLQATATYYQQRELVLKQLVTEVLAYSEKHPDIDPILISIGAKQGKAPAPTKPAGK